MLSRELNEDATSRLFVTSNSDKSRLCRWEVVRSVRRLMPGAAIVGDVGGRAAVGGFPVCARHRHGLERFGLLGVVNGADSGDSGGAVRERQAMLHDRSATLKTTLSVDASVMARLKRESGR